MNWSREAFKKTPDFVTLFGRERGSEQSHTFESKFSWTFLHREGVVYKKCPNHILIYIHKEEYMSICTSET